MAARLCLAEELARTSCLHDRWGAWQGTDGWRRGVGHTSPPCHSSQVPPARFLTGGLAGESQGFAVKEDRRRVKWPGQARLGFPARPPSVTLWFHTQLDEGPETPWATREGAGWALPCWGTGAGRADRPASASRWASPPALGPRVPAPPHCHSPRCRLPPAP